MKIDFSPFEKAIASLEDILTQKMDSYIRDGVIQRFEYTFELSWKYMQRVLKDQGVVAGSPKQILRASFQAGLIVDIELWMGFLKERNLTTHTYNEDTAEEVFQSAKRFPNAAKQLLEILKNEIEADG